MKMKVKNMATLFALLAASIYSINIPLSKLLLKHVETTMMAGLLYFGAGIGLIILTNIMKMVRLNKIVINKMMEAGYVKIMTKMENF